MKKILGIILALSLSTWAVDAFYRHHQRSTTTSLEASLVNREIGIDASSRNSLIAKKADGSLIHLISKEMDSVTLSGVVSITGNTIITPLVGSGVRLVTADASGTLGNGATIAGNYVYSGSITAAAGTFTGLTASLPVFTNGSKALASNAMTGTGSVVMSVSPTLTGTVGAAAITATGVVTADSIVSTKFYEEGSFTATYVGGTTSPTGTARWVRVGKQITLTLPSLSATSNSTAFNYTGMPAGLAPATNQSCPLPPSAATDNSAAINTAGVYIDQSGPTIRFQVNGVSSGWTSSGTKGISGGVSAVVVITYTKY